jgi:hypothetical protein
MFTVKTSPSIDLCKLPWTIIQNNKSLQGNYLKFDTANNRAALRA